MTGTIAYLAKYPEIASRIRAAVHLDMVGADPHVTKSVLHVTRSPWSIATVTDDVADVFGRYVIDGAMRAAGDGDMTRAIRSRGGRLRRAARARWRSSGASAPRHGRASSPDSSRWRRR